MRPGLAGATWDGRRKTRRRRRRHPAPVTTTSATSTAAAAISPPEPEPWWWAVAPDARVELVGGVLVVVGLVVAGVALAFEVDGFHHAAVLHLQTGNDAVG